MSDINSVVISGRLARDPESRMAGENFLLKFGVAVNHWNSKTKSEEADFYDVTVWGKRAEGLAKILQKGSPVTVQGSLRTEKWQNQQGENRSRITINAFEVIAPKTEGRSGHVDNSTFVPNDDGGDPLPDDDDLPF